MSRLAGRVALVSGAANGIGAAIAARFTAEGARVAAIDREAMAPDLAWTMQADCTDAAALAAFAGEAASRLGPPDILVNNVGQSAREQGSRFCESEEATWRFVLEVSLFTTLRLSRLVAPGMQARGYGRIINLSSDTAFAGDAGLADYATAKAGIGGFTRVLARELAPHGITVNAMAPGAIRTRAHDKVPAAVIARIIAATPAGFVAAPEDVAGLATYLASAEARFVTGQTILIDGGRWMT